MGLYLHLHRASGFRAWTFALLGLYRPPYESPYLI